MNRSNSLLYFSLSMLMLTSVPTAKANTSAAMKWVVGAFAAHSCWTHHKRTPSDEPDRFTMKELLQKLRDGDLGVEEFKDFYYNKWCGHAKATGSPMREKGKVVIPAIKERGVIGWVREHIGDMAGAAGVLGTLKAFADNKEGLSVASLMASGADYNPFALMRRVVDEVVNALPMVSDAAKATAEVTKK